MTRSIAVSSSAVFVALLAGSMSCSSDSDDPGNPAGSGGKKGAAGTGFAGTGGSSGAAAGGSGGGAGSGGSSGSGGTVGKGGSAGATDMCPQGTYFGKTCMQIRTEVMGLGPCELCLTSTCCPELEACFANAMCAGLNQCLAQRCLNDPDRAACGERECAVCLMAQSTRDLVSSYRTCTATKCGSVCGSDGGVSDGGVSEGGAADAGGG